MRKVCLLSWTSLVFVLAAACSNSSDGSANTGGASGAGAQPANNAAVDPAASGGSTTSGTGNTTTAAADTTTNGTMTGAMQAPAVNLGDLLPMCDTTVVAPTECGGTTCAPVDALAATTACVVGCCAGNECGTRTAGAEGSAVPNSEACVPLPVADDRCPGVSLAFINIPGCCVSSTNECGLVDTLLTRSCVPRASAMSLVSGLPGVGAGGAAGTGTNMDTQAAADAGMAEGSAAPDGGVTGTNSVAPAIDLTPVNCDGTTP